MDTKWVQPAVSDLASIPLEGHQYRHKLEQTLSVKSPPLSTLKASLTATILFPSKRVEPLDMARSHRQTTENRNKTGYTQSATTDEERQTTTSFVRNRPIKRVKHPADRSSILTFLQRLLSVCVTLIVSLPCILFLTISIPICWFVRAFIRLTCRHHCIVTPCNCSYLTASDLFWFYNSNVSSSRDKSDETTKLNSLTSSPTAAAIFFLEGKILFVLNRIEISIRVSTFSRHS